MAIHELYVGGPPSRNYSQAMFPLPTFSETDAAFTGIGMAAHKGPVSYNATRLLDFSGDHALAEFLRENTVAQGDTLGVVIVPRNMLYLGMYFKVVNPVTGITITPKFRGKASTFAAINGAVAGEGFIPASGTDVAAVTEGVVSLALAVFDIKPDMLDLTLTALPATKLAGFKMIVSPVLVATDAGGYR